MISIRKFVVLTTLLMLFSDRLFLTVASINIFAFYLVVVLNLALLAWAGCLWLPRGLFVFLGVLLASGLLGLTRGTTSALSLAKDFCGIVPNLIYACAFVRFMRFDVERCFALYARAAFYVAVAGLIILPFQWGWSPRLTSVMAEPAGFCLVCIPALYYYADLWVRYRKFGLRFLTLLAACLLTVASTGFLGILFGMYLLGSRYRFGKFVAPALVILAGLGLYSISDFFRLRMEDTLLGINNRDMGGINVSSFGVVSNIFVTEKAFADHPLIGGGLGSYVVVHDRYVGQLLGVELFSIEGLDGLGRWDASSLLLRIAAEFGIVGLVAAFRFLWIYWPWDASAKRQVIAKSILCYVFLKFLRSGTYFNAEEWFFFVLYAVNGMMAGVEARRGIRSSSPAGESPQLSVQPA